MMEPYIVKLGGSLMGMIPTLIPVLTRQARPLLIIPGGGRFAEEVRHCGIGGDPAHWMAIAAMEQYGWYISAHGLNTTTELSEPDDVKVFLPYAALRRDDPLPHRWDVTSDTIAAWVAHRLGKPLILLKSVDGIRSGGTLLRHVSDPLCCSEVDPCLIPFVLRNNVFTTIVNGRFIERVNAVLRGEQTLGTVVSASF
jgi:aspartokinase-like uncharacterized kinase